MNNNDQNQKRKETLLLQRYNRLYQKSKQKHNANKTGHKKYLSKHITTAHKTIQNSRQNTKPYKIKYQEKRHTKYKF